MKFLLILFIYFASNVIFTAVADDCDRIFHTGKKKTLVQFIDSNNQADLAEEKLHDEIWKELIEHFSDNEVMAFEKIDCAECSQYCNNFFNESQPSYSMLYGDLFMSSCVRPINFLKARNYVYDYMSKKYKKKKNFDIALTHCNIIYPELRGIEIFSDNFFKSIEKGLSLVFFNTQWCHYCKEFYPLWSKLIDAFEDTDVNFYRLDCITYKDFCIGQKAIGYPTLGTYCNGEYFEEYLGSENIEELVQFTKHHMKMCAEKKFLKIY